MRNIDESRKLHPLQLGCVETYRMHAFVYFKHLSATSVLFMC